MELCISKCKMDLHSVFKTASQFLVSNYHTESHFTIFKTRWKSTTHGTHTLKHTVTVWYSEGQSRVTNQEQENIFKNSIRIYMCCGSLYHQLFS
jgi:hypothetical protein